jgi:hypothetical protein
MFIVKDWCGNDCFNGKTFDSFEDAWAFVFKTFDHLGEEEFIHQMIEFEVINLGSV